MKQFNGLRRFLSVLCSVSVLVACGGGGGGSPAVPADARNGSYTLLAADTREHALTLDFDAGTYTLVDSAGAQSGTFTASGEAFLLSPGNSVGAAGTSTTRFTVATDTIIGEATLSGSAVPFVAARKFVNTLAGAAGTYNFLGRTIDTAGGTPNTTIQQAKITADGQLLVCFDMVIFPIDSCPPASLSTATVTVSGDTFTAVAPDGTYNFRIAQVGADKVYLRATGSVGTTRRFIVGVPAAGTLTTGTFVGGSTVPAWGTVTLGGGTVTSTAVEPDGSSSTITGTATPVPAMPNVVVITTATDGDFFATATSELGVLIAARDNPSAPGYMAVGKRR